MVRLWDLISLVRAVVREKGNLGIFQFHHNLHLKTSLHPSHTSCLNRERNQVRRQVKKPGEKLSGKPCEEPHHKPKSKPIPFHEFCGKDGHKKEFCYKRKREARMAKELARMCLSLVCHYLRERVLCKWLQHGEIGELQVEASLLAEDHQQDRSG
jgi:hypothetical protein